MANVCAWCESVLQKNAAADARITHSICPGCLADLRGALSREGLVIAQRGPGVRTCDPR
jgi:hypothetical protein